MPIDKIAENYPSALWSPDVESVVAGLSTTTTLFGSSHLYVVYGDEDFIKQSNININRIIGLLKRDCLILTFDKEYPSSNLFKNFSKYITYFPIVEDNIALEFVDSELSLSLSSKTELAKNCKNDYSKICIESDKIRNYAQGKHITEQLAFDELTTQDQLLYEYPEYNPDDLMNDILQGKFKDLSYWYKILKELHPDQFWITLSSIFNNYIIAYLIVRYGKYDGSRVAYDCGLPWYRIKQIRELDIKYNADYLLDTAIGVAELDNKVKIGSISVEDLFEYFLTMVM